MNDFNLNILVVEDNLSFSLELQMLLEDLNYNVVTSVDNSAAALEAIFSQSPDLIFMDIEIKGSMNGVEVAQKISHLDIPVLFISSRKEPEIYAEALKSNMIGYLVKPVEKISLRTGIQLAISKAHSLKTANTSSEVPTNIITKDKFYFKKKDTFHKVAISEIAFVRSDDNYCEVYTIDKKSFTSRITLSKMENMLPKGKFIKTHRQYIVQVNHIDAVDFHDSTCKVLGKEIPVSRSKRKELEQILKMLS